MDTYHLIVSQTVYNCPEYFLFASSGSYFRYTVVNICSVRKKLTCKWTQLLFDIQILGQHLIKCTTNKKLDSTKILCYFFLSLNICFFIYLQISAAERAKNGIIRRGRDTYLQARVSQFRQANVDAGTLACFLDNSREECLHA